MRTRMNIGTNIEMGTRQIYTHTKIFFKTVINLNNAYKDELFFIPLSLQENVLLATNFSDQKLLATIAIHLGTNLQNKKLLVTKIVIIINKKL